MPRADPLLAQRRRRRWVLELGLGLGLGLFSVQLWLCRGLLAGDLPQYRDLARLFIPLKQYLWDELQAGRFPQWWPWDGLGMPLASLPLASLFHPTTALYALLPFQPAFALQFFLPLPAAAYGTYRLGRRLGLRAAWAVLSAAAYSLSGYFLSVTEFTFTSLAAAALPWVAFSALRLGRRGGVWWLAASTALVVLAGDPVLTALAVGLALVLGARRSRQRSGKLVAAIGWGALLAAVQLVPTGLLFLESSRAQGTVHGSSFWALGGAQLLGFVWPPGGYTDAQLFPSTYLGISTAALAAVGCVARGRRRWRGRLLLIAVLSLGLAVGDLLPMWTLAGELIPFWRALRFPAKAVAPFVLVVAVCAGWGAQHLARRWASMRRPAVQVAAVALVALELARGNGFLLEAGPLSPPPPLAVQLGALGVSRTGPTYAFRWALEPGAKESTERQLRSLAPASAARFGLPTSNAYLPGTSSAYGEVSRRELWTWLGPLASIFGSKFLVGTSSEDAGPTVARDDTNGVVVVELADALPRAYLSQGVRRRGRAVVPAALRDPQFRPGREVLLAGEEAGPAERASDQAHTPAEVHLVGGDVEVLATATAPSVLVLNESYFAGVTATDGVRPLSVFRVNHLVRGVWLEAGAHRIRFGFQTPGLRLGAGLSMVGVLVWVGALTRRLRGCRWPRGRSP